MVRTNPKTVLFHQAGVIIYQPAEKVVRVNGRRRLFLGIFLAAGFAPLAAFAILPIRALWYDPKWPLIGGPFQSFLALYFFSYLPLMFAVVAWFEALQWFFPTSLTLNYDRCICLYRRRLFVCRTIFFDSIESIDICVLAGRGGFNAWTCICVAGQKARLPVEYATNDFSQEALRQITPVADMLGQLLDCPVQIYPFSHTSDRRTTPLIAWW